MRPMLVTPLDFGARMPKLPKIRIKLVSPGDVRPPKRKRLTPEQAGIVPRIEHLYPFKAMIERLFGNPAFMKIKMGASMREWRNACLKLLDSIELSVKSTVEIADQDWFAEVYRIIKEGRERVRGCHRIDDLFANLSVILATLVFTQLGHFPMRRHSSTTIPLSADWWRLGGFRSVLYVQNDKQRDAQANLESRRAENVRRIAQEESKNL
jgi:hypothetical protein